MHDYDVMEPYEVVSRLQKSFFNRLYGVKTMDDTGWRCIVVCKEESLAKKIEGYINRNKDLFLVYDNTEEDREVISRAKEFYTVDNLNEYLDNNYFVSVLAKQLGDMQEYFSEYFIEDPNGNNIVPIEIINEDYIYGVDD